MNMRTRRSRSGRYWTSRLNSSLYSGPNRERLCINRIARDYLGPSIDEWRLKAVGSEIHPEDVERLKPEGKSRRNTLFETYLEK
jgi:hypothetical protein